MAEVDAFLLGWTKGANMYMIKMCDGETLLERIPALFLQKKDLPKAPASELLGLGLTSKTL